jgi:two-component system NtrC family sensor kinase
LFNLGSARAVGINAYSFGELSTSDNLRQVFARLQRKSAAFKDLGVFNVEGTHAAYEGPYELAGRQY